MSGQGVIMSNTNSILFKQFHKQFEDTKDVDDLRKRLKYYLNYMSIREIHDADVTLHRYDIELLLDLIEEKYGS
jgi:hypothetical protein